MLLPVKSKNPPEQFPWVTCVILAVNILVFIVVNQGGDIPEEALKSGGLYPGDPAPFTFLSSMFLHADIFHLLGNMWFLYLFGFAVEGRMGWWKFSILYLLAGFIGSVLHMAVFGHLFPNIPSIGASGAIMGCVGAAVYMFPHSQILIFWTWWFRWGTFPVAMMWVGLFYVGGDVLTALLFGGHGGVANMAHIGGAAAGFLIPLALREKRDSEEVSEAKATLSDTKDYSILSAYELADLAKTQPQNTELVLHWAMRIIRDGRAWPVDLIERVHALQQKMMENEDPGALGHVFTKLPPEARIRPVFLLEIGSRVEKAGSPQVASQVYQAAFHSPLATEDDQQAAAFRNAMLMEAWFQNYAGAEDLYKWILQRWPVCPMEPQIRARLNVVTPRATAQRAAAHPTA